MISQPASRLVVQQLLLARRNCCCCHHRFRRRVGYAVITRTKKRSRGRSRAGSRLTGEEALSWRQVRIMAEMHAGGTPAHDASRCSGAMFLKRREVEPPVVSSVYDWVED